MKKQIQLFEPISESQESMVYYSARNLPKEILDKMVADLIGIPDVSALSKQEASFIIDRLLGATEPNRPRWPKTADQLKGDTSELAYYRQIYFIRKTIQDLGWSLERFKDWLHKYTGQTSIRNLNREQVRKLHFLAMDLVKQRN